MLVKDLVAKMCFEKFVIFDSKCNNHICYSEFSETWIDYADKEVVLVTADRVKHHIVIGVD